jgi:hypothetical protein
MNRRFLALLIVLFSVLAVMSAPVDGNVRLSTRTQLTPLIPSFVGSRDSQSRQGHSEEAREFISTFP